MKCNTLLYYIMKHLGLFFTALLVACGSDDTTSGGSNPPEPSPEDSVTQVETTRMVRGADISWYTEMAADGMKFHNKNGEPRDCPALMKEIGMDAVRLRVWVNPENKGCDYSDMADVVKKAQAAQNEGLRIMIDFHYSDWWADPSRQETPQAWAGYDFDALKSAVHTHTTSTLEALKEAGVHPEWIQIGNETRNGMLHPQGQLWNNSGDITGGWQRFARLYAEGYAAAHAVFPEAKVMPHLNHAYEDNTWWFDKLKAQGAKFDMIALSHYPQVDDTSQTWSQLNTVAVQRIGTLVKRYGVPVMVSEIGVRSSDANLGATVLGDFLVRLKSLNPTYAAQHPKSDGIDPSQCAGVFYWEPEVYGGWKPSSYEGFGWSAYDMGAFTSEGKPNAALLKFVER